MTSKWLSRKLLLTVGVSILDLVLLGATIRYPQYKSQILWFAGMIGAKTGIYVLGQSYVDKADVISQTLPLGIEPISQEK